MEGACSTVNSSMKLDCVAKQFKIHVWASAVDEWQVHSSRPLNSITFKLRSKPSLMRTLCTGRKWEKCDLKSSPNRGNSIFETLMKYIPRHPTKEIRYAALSKQISARTTPYKCNISSTAVFPVPQCRLAFDSTQLSWVANRLSKYRA